MVTLQSVMLVALGVFAAGFLGLFLAPLYRKRTARLAIEDLKRSMPLSEAEIRADKDRLRAENAIAIHRLETRLEESALVAARQRVEINRRDAAISSLESDVSRLGTVLDEHENARRVLEQTITERLPMVERRLSEAKQLLSQRDREIAMLSSSASKNARALEEATQINTKQREELHRLNATLATRQAHNRSSFADAGVETEIALRGEIESLRAKTRDQSELIERLRAGRGRGVFQRKATAKSDEAVATSSQEVEKLRVDLAEAKHALCEAQGESEKGKESTSGLETELSAVNSEADRLRRELSRLKAALNVYESSDKDHKATRETKVALKARVGSLENELKEQAETIRRLKAELAAGNDKMARQAAHYVDVIRRLGGGTQHVSGASTSAAPETKSHPTTPAAAGNGTARRRTDPLMARLQAPRRDGAALTARSATRDNGAEKAPRERREEAKVGDFIKALGGNTSTKVGDNATPQKPSATQSQAQETKPVQDAKPDPKKKPSTGQRRPGLLERLASGDKPVA